MRWPDSAAIKDSQGLFMAARVGRKPARDFPQKDVLRRALLNLVDASELRAATQCSFESAITSVSGHYNTELKTIRQQVGPSDDKSGMRLALVKRKGFGLKAVMLFFGVAVAGTAMSAPAGKQLEQRAEAVAALHMSEVSWHKGGWNEMMMLNATVQNSGKRDVKDIRIVCDHLSNNETMAASNAATIYGPFPAGKSKSIRNFDMGSYRDQTKGTNCSIVDATLATKRWGRPAR